ncbi:MAG: carboxymuconolactone decarboxylase family protein [Acidobacteriota bacterium]
MYLPAVENNTELRGGWAEMIGCLKAAAMPVPQMFYLLAFKPEITQHLERFAHGVMRGPSPLSPGFRELIAAFTGSINGCAPCRDCHAAVAAGLLDDDLKTAAVLEDFRSAPISEEEKLLFAFIELVNGLGAQEGDFAVLREAGWSDEALYDAITVCALANLLCRWADGAGVSEAPLEVQRLCVRRLIEQGYLLSTGEPCHRKPAP